MRRLTLPMPFPLPEQKRYVPYDMMLNDIGFWYPILKRTDVKTPKTIIINTFGDNLPIENIAVAMDKIGYPCFFRGGSIAASLKHQWNDTCFVANRITLDEIKQRCEKIIRHCINGNQGAEPMLYEYWAVREYIDSCTVYSYQKMPLKKEIRVFINQNRPICMHSYWKEQIPDGMISFTDNEIKSINNEAVKVAKYFYGFWSCDFLLSKNGDWYCIDMALGEDSYHPKECKYLNTFNGYPVYKFTESESLCESLSLE